VVDEMGCIQFPLSILEAAANHIGIVTTPFCGVNTFLSEGPGLLYAENKTQILDSLESLKNAEAINTREIAYQFSWQHVSERVISEYVKLVN